MNYFSRYFTIVYLFIKGSSDSSTSLIHIIFVHVKDIKIIIAFAILMSFLTSFIYSLNSAFLVSFLKSFRDM